MASTVAIIQARMSSERLPGKSMASLAGRPLVGWVVRAAREAAVDSVVVATSTDATDDVLADWCRDEAVPVVRGPLDDVLARFLLVLDEHQGDVVVRLTADCPLLDPAVIRAAVGARAAADADYLSTTTPRSLPRGLDVEVVQAAALRAAAIRADGVDRVHVTSYIYGHPEEFSVAGLVFAPAADDLRVTVDEQRDLEAVEGVVEELGDRAPAWRDVVAVLRRRPDLVARNREVRQKLLGDG